MTFYIQRENQIEAEKCDTLEQAAMAILGHDVQTCGIAETKDADGDTEYTPWVRRMDGRIQKWTACTAYDLEQVYWNIADVADQSRPFQTLLDEEQYLSMQGDILKDAYASR